MKTDFLQFYSRWRKLLDQRGSFKEKAGRFAAVLASPASSRALQVNCTETYPSAFQGGLLLLRLQWRRDGRKKSLLNAGSLGLVEDGYAALAFLMAFAVGFGAAVFAAFVLRGEFLLDLGCDGSHVHLVDLGGYAQCFAGSCGRSYCLESDQVDQQTP